MAKLLRPKFLFVRRLRGLVLVLVQGAEGSAETITVVLAKRHRPHIQPTLSLMTMTTMLMRVMMMGYAQLSRAQIMCVWMDERKQYKQN